MAVTWLDAAELNPFLDGGMSLVIANEAEPGSEATIAGYACALHGDGTSPEVRRSTDVSLDPGESFASVEERLSASPTIAVEAVLRVVSPLAGNTVDVYVRSDAARTEPIDSIEVGLIATERAPPDAVEVSGVEGISAYIALEP